MSADTNRRIWPPAPQGQHPPDEPGLGWWKNLFFVSARPASRREVVSWWQSRRLTYNLIVLGLGIPNFLLYLFFLITSGQLPPSEDAVEPLGLLFAPVIVPLGVNVCYTFGMIAELVWRGVSKDTTRTAGRVLMQAGVGFSLFVIFLPTITWGFIWFEHIVLKR